LTGAAIPPFLPSRPSLPHPRPPGIPGNLRSLKFPAIIPGNLKIFLNCHFWATVCKTVRPMLSDQCLSVCPVLSVCDVRALWPNGWTGIGHREYAKRLVDEAGTWNGGRPQPRRLCVTWGPSPLPQKRTEPLPNCRPIPIVHGQTAGCINRPMLLVMDIARPQPMALRGSR